MADLYEILEVSHDASMDEIKRNYRRLARECHPDANPDDLEAQERAADVLVLDGNPLEAFARLTGAIRFTSGADRDRLRTHLLDLFEVVGPDDPAVSRARIDLANALF